MDFIYDLGLFAVKALMIVGSIIAVLIVLAQLLTSGRGRHEPSIEIEKLNSRFKSLRRQLQRQLMSKKSFKSSVKQEKKSEKKDAEPKETRIFVLEFNGDIRASQVESLREEVTALLSVAKSGDEVVVRLESGGGLVTSYGLAAAQLERLKSHGLRLTVCVDKVAASGGYMMACVADRILAAPFAVLGSIGVIAQVPNFNKVLKKHDIEYREVTAGEFKRTVTVFGEVTETGLRKFKEQIEDTHMLFKDFVSKHRPQLDISKVATGEYWYGTQAVTLGLADDVITSDEYIFKYYDIADVYRVEFKGPKRLVDRLTGAASKALEQAALRLWTELERRRIDH
jgi:serine protease SohB